MERSSRRPPTREGPHRRQSRWPCAITDVLAAIDGAIVFEFDYRPSSGPSADDQPRLSVGASGGSVRLESPQVYRDVYYLGPGGATQWEAPQAVAASQWFVLGDNVPVSLDSRLWAAIDAQTILGPVRPWNR